MDRPYPPASPCGCGPASRRSFLTGAAATGGLVALPSGLSAKAAPGRIDVHRHFYPNDIIPGSLPPIPQGPVSWSLSRDLEDMEKGGVATALMSSFAPLAGTPASRAKAARGINEAGARLAADHRGRYALLAALPMPDIDAALAEAAYALDVLKAQGLAVYTNVGDRWLGDAAFDPLWSELNRRKAVVFVHPTSADCCRNLVAGVPDVLIEFGADTTRCIASLIFNGTTTRFPDIRFIFCHAGGATTAVIERFLGGTQGQITPGITTKGVDNFAAKQPPGGVLNALGKLYYDTAQATNAATLGALRKIVPVSQIVYGSDFQYQTAEVTTRQLRQSGVFSRRELEAVERGNALTLFPSLA